MLRNPRVIVTRPEPDASRFAAELSAAGFEPILSPAMEIVWGSAAPDLSGVGALAFTSANGVRAFRRKAAPPLLPAFVVGEMTAIEARSCGFGKVMVAGGDVSSLADAIAGAAGFTGNVLHICGEDQAGDLAGALSARGIPAKRAALYATRAIERLSADAAAALATRPEAEWVALFSPRSAEIFLRQVELAKAPLSHTRAACLSIAVADAARRAKWAGVDIAKERSGAALIQLVLGARPTRP